MKHITTLLYFIWVIPVFAECPLPIPEYLNVSIVKAQEEAHALGYDNRKLAPKLQNLTVQELAHWVTDLARGRTPLEYEKAITLAFDVADNQGTTALLRYALDYDGDGYNIISILSKDFHDSRLVSTALKLIVPRGGGRPSGIKLLSDIDDTIFANLVDPRYKKMNKGERYPGVEALYRAIVQEPAEIDMNWKGSLPLTALSARPVIRIADTSEEITADLSGRLGGICAMSLGGKIVSSGIGTVFTLLNQAPPLKNNDFIKYRDLILKKTLLEDEFSFLQNQEIRIGQVKFDNFRRFSMVYPDYDFIFFGDSGQADAHTAKLIMEYNTQLPGPGKAIVTFIHDLRINRGEESSRGMSPTTAVHDALQRDDVILFRNYIQAALIAYRRGNTGTIKKIIDAGELINVITQALEELETVRFKKDIVNGKVIGDLVREGYAEDAMAAVIEIESTDPAHLTDELLDRVSQFCKKSNIDCPNFRSK